MARRSTKWIDKHTSETIGRISQQRKDAETLRRVREWAEQLLNHTPSAGDCGAWYMGLQRAAGDVLTILNGTERKENKP